MHFTLKSYQVLKLKNYFQNKSLFIVVHCAKLNLKEWTDMEQKLKKLNLNYYKLLNKITLKEIKNSIYINYNFIVNGSVFFISFDSSKNSIDIVHNLNQLQNSLNFLLITICLKLNNKFYSSQQLIKLQNLSYKEKVFKFNKVLNKFFKASYMLT